MKRKKSAEIRWVGAFDVITLILAHLGKDLLSSCQNRWDTMFKGHSSST